jgi:hypothetical protein
LEVSHVRSSSVPACNQIHDIVTFIKIYYRSANRISRDTVFLFPDGEDLITVGHEKFIHKDASKFLQFSCGKCTTTQLGYHKVAEVFSLGAKKGNNKLDTMVIHPNALPCPMEWPSSPYYKAQGKHLLMPSEWRSQGDAKDDDVPSVVYDFKQVTPVKAFRPSFPK